MCTACMVLQLYLLYHLIHSEYLLGSKIKHGIFWDLILVWGILLGFAGSSRDFFRY